LIAQQQSAYGTYRCPSCDRDSENASLSVRSQSTAEESSYDDLREHWRGFFKEKAFFSYFRCAACGMLYSPAYFTPQQLDELYASMAPNMDAVNDDALERTQFGYFKELARVSDLKGGGFLEIGPDVGMFTQHCVRNGDFDRFWLCEPNVAVHDQLRRRLEGKTYSISTSLLDLAEIPEGSISVAAMIHVLDHILEPLAFLRTLRPKMADGGVLLIVTHNERSLMARTLKARWPAYCLQHPHLFNPQSIAGLLRSGGFDTTRVSRSVNHFPVTFLAKHLIYALKLGEPNLPAWPALQIPLKLGNMITFATPSSVAP
jgi:hypothetical protein